MRPTWSSSILGSLANRSTRGRNEAHSIDVAGSSMALVLDPLFCQCSKDKKIERKPADVQGGIHTIVHCFKGGRHQ